MCCSWLVASFCHHSCQDVCTSGSSLNSEMPFPESSLNRTEAGQISPSVLFLPFGFEPHVRKSLKVGGWALWCFVLSKESNFYLLSLRVRCRGAVCVCAHARSARVRRYKFECQWRSKNNLGCCSAHLGFLREGLSLVRNSASSLDWRGRGQWGHKYTPPCLFCFF